MKRQAGVLECLITALRLNRNDPETLRCAAGALGSICSEDVGQLRERAVKVVDGGEWPKEVLLAKPPSVDISPKNLEVFQSLLTWVYGGAAGVGGTPSGERCHVFVASGRWDRNSMLSAHQESSRSTSPGVTSKSLGWAGVKAKEKSK